MAALTVEHLKVMAASRACLRIQFTYLVGGRMVEREIDGGQSSPYRTLWSSEKSMAASRAPTGPYGRAPKG